jgi:hypothetical protein
MVYNWWLQIQIRLNFSHLFLYIISFMWSYLATDWPRSDITLHPLVSAHTGIKVILFSQVAGWMTKADPKPCRFHRWGNPQELLCWVFGRSGDCDSPFLQAELYYNEGTVRRNNTASVVDLEPIIGQWLTNLVLESAFLFSILSSILTGRVTAGKLITLHGP